MANELLDFVMSLVRDPDAAARYAADPAAAIADAQLTNVTSVDVNNLIPMVSDSLSMAAPTPGSLTNGGLDTGLDSNVWTSGAATAAFDAFAPHVPETVIQDVPGVIDTGFDAPDLDLAQSVPSVDFNDFSQVSSIIDEPADALGVDDPVGWESGVVDVGQHETPDHPTDHSGFDLF